MARVTVEDCIENVDSRFELIMLASKRARELASGAMPTLPRDKDKNPVIALREIAEKTIDLNSLRESTITGYQRMRPIEEQEEDLDSILAADAQISLQSAKAEPEEQLIGGSADVAATDDDDSQLIG